MSVAQIEMARSFETETRVEAPGRALSVRTESKIVFTSLFALYAAIGAVLVFHYDSIAPDALSRVGNASYVLFSRDPKLAAIGFVWTPLPSLLLLPLLPLKFLWPSLLQLGFFANLESAFCMALAAAVIARCLEEQGVHRRSRIVLVALFALNPMILYYGANGMSEALLVLFLVCATRWLARWTNDGSTAALVRTGMYLALAYLARYEAIAAGVAVTVFVAAVAWQRSRGDRRERRAVALADAALVGVPIAGAIAAFALASWIIVGHAFETFSSRYGNTAQVATAARGIAAVHGGTSVGAVWYLVRQLGHVAPAIAIIVVLAGLTAFRRGSPRFLTPVVVLGSVLAFQELAFIKGASFGWLRFQITAIPMVILMVGLIIGAPRARLDPVDGAVHERRIVRNRRFSHALLIGLVAVGCVTVTNAMRSASLGREEHAQLLPVVQSALGRPRHSEGSLHEFATERSVAATLDQMQLPNGTVLTDDALSFPIVLASQHPKQFVITSDRDFQTAVAYPAANGIRYVLVSLDAKGLDAITAAYPNLYANGGGIAHLVRDFPAPSSISRSWRLYEIDGS